LALPKASLKMAGWWCLMAFMRRLITPSPLFRRGCSTGSTLRRFFGSLDRACNERCYVTSRICLQESQNEQRCMKQKRKIEKIIEQY
jgi:hypothetical protein